MIKTHKPRGHFWTCASVFQRSKEIRNVRFDDCVPPDAAVLDPCSDEPLRPGEQAAKRRKIEKLVHDFLDGEVPIIQSAAMDTRTLKATVEWNARSRTGKKFVMPRVDFSHDVPDLWVDVNDPLEPYRAVVEKKEISSNPRRLAVPPEVRCVRKDAQVGEEKEASSACRQIEPMAFARPSLNLGLDDMNRTAVLQNGRLDRAMRQNPLAAVFTEESRTDPALYRGPIAVTRPKYIKNKNHSGTERLVQRQKIPYQLLAEESVNESSPSGIETLSGHSHHPRPRADRQRSPILATLERTSLDGGYDMLKSNRFWMRGIEKAEASADTVGGDEATTTGKALYHTALEQRDIEDPSTPSSLKYPCECKTRSLQRQVTVQPTSEGLVSPWVDGGQLVKHAAEQTSTSVSPQRKTLANEAIPCENIERAGYIGIQSPDKDETPLLFRKRKLKSQKTGARKRRLAKPTRLNPSRKMVLSSSGPQHYSILDTDGGEPITPASPIQDISLADELSFGSRFSITLVDEHLNTVLPAQPGSMRSSSFLKKAIREEMKGAGAEISHIEVDAPNSSSNPPKAMTLSSDGTTSCDVKERLAEDVQRDSHQAKVTGKNIDEPTTTRWSGPQLALFQARRDPCASQESTNPCESTLIGYELRQSIDAASPQVIIQSPLQQLSQEQLPETQTIIDGCSPLSDIKRSLPLTRSTVTPSPHSARSDREQPVISTESFRKPVPPAFNTLNKSRRSRSFWYSSSTTEIASPVIIFPISKPILSAEREEKSLSQHDRTPWSPVKPLYSRESCTANTSAKRDIAVDLPDQETINDHTRDSTTLPSLTAFPAVHTQLFRHDSNVSQTVTELAADVLGLNNDDSTRTRAS